MWYFAALSSLKTFCFRSYKLSDRSTYTLDGFTKRIFSSHSVAFSCVQMDWISITLGEVYTHFPSSKIGTRSFRMV